MMNKSINISVSIPKDDEGMLGRECPKCKMYFKIKPGTGLRDTTHCICPYCEHKDGSRSFTTKEQLDFAKSVAIKQVLGPSLQKLEDSFKKLERTTRHSLIKIKVKGTGFSLPIKYYREKDLEAQVECDHCGLNFSIYGIFASCPDCNRLNTMSIFKKSIEACKNRLAVIKNIPDSEEEVIENIIVDALSGGVAAFDGLGKRLKKEFPLIFPQKPKNLFQNLDALDEILKNKLETDLNCLIDEKVYSSVYYYFQVRHLWSHNFGEADIEFIEKTKSDKNLLGKKIVPDREEIASFLDNVYNLGVVLRNKQKDPNHSRREGR